MTVNEAKYLTSDNKQFPYMYGLPKLHKPGKDIRPIINCRDCPFYKLSKWLLNRFKALEAYETRSVKNSIELAKTLENEEVQDDEVLVSFDVKSLFPSVPVDKALQLLSKWLKNSGLMKQKVKEFLRLTEICTSQTAFRFNNKMYRQVSGLFMGNPISPFLSDLFMSNLEIERIVFRPDMFLLWRRYVDDVLSKIKKGQQTLALEYLNHLEESIEFTIEEEKDQKLPFLDLLLDRSNNKIEFDIYRKPTDTGNYIKGNAHNPKVHKTAAFRSMAYRMMKIPLSDENRKREENNIISIAKKNHFQEEEIRQVINKVKRKVRMNNLTTLKGETKDKRYRKFTFHPKWGPKFKKVFQKLDIELSFTNNHNLMNRFSKKIETTEKDDSAKPGIYEINCNTCHKCYVGQTKRSLKIRGQEHVRNMKNREITRSAVAHHFWSTGHNINFEPRLLKERTELSENRRKYQQRSNPVA
nr:PREDICTED: uncharacterized protein LOC109038254 [Bemisia tabaci]